MGAVYVVEQVSTGKQRALKVMHPQLVNDAKLRQRFVQEAQIGARIESDHVVAGRRRRRRRRDGHPVARDGAPRRARRSAQHIARRGALALRRAARGLRAARATRSPRRTRRASCTAISSPRTSSSRVAAPRRRAFTVKVLDFGIAKLVAEAHAHARPPAIGTPLWMAPEQTEVGSAVAPATDVWALGLLAFYCLTGHALLARRERRAASAAALLARGRARSARRRERARGGVRASPTRSRPGFDGLVRALRRARRRRSASPTRARRARRSSRSSPSSTSAPLGIAPPVRGALVIQPTPFPPGMRQMVDRRRPRARRDVAARRAIRLRVARPFATSGHADQPRHRRAGRRRHRRVRTSCGRPARSRSRSQRSSRSALSSDLAACSRRRAIEQSGADRSSSTSAPAENASAFSVQKPALKACPPGMAQIAGGSFFMGSKGDTVDARAVLRRHARGEGLRVRGVREEGQLQRHRARPPRSATTATS